METTLALDGNSACSEEQGRIAGSHHTNVCGDGAHERPNGAKPG